MKVNLKSFEQPEVWESDEDSSQSMSEESVEEIVDTYVTFQRKKRARLGH